MGCDIHLQVEVREPGKPSWDTNLHNSTHPAFLPQGWHSLDEISYRGRNYNLFSMLADVRNGYGFAGCPTGQGFIPISAPKGVPEDASWDYTSLVESWDGDGHSHSWLTLRELLNYNWNETTTIYGVISFQSFMDWNCHDRNYYKVGPQDYAGDIWGHGIKTITMEEADLALLTLQAHPEWNPRTYRAGEANTELVEKVYPKTYVRVRWEEKYSKSAVGFFQDTLLPMLAHVGGVDGDLDSIRICFFFDN